ncbi:MAG: Hpt domain-containing protein [Lentihominibacter sp.]
MDVRECYRMLAADYDEVRARLINEERIEKYLYIFLTGDYLEVIERSLAEENWSEAFRAVHSLKGVSLTLGFRKLHASSDALCDKLRGCIRPEGEITGILQELKTEYDRIKNIIFYQKSLTP